MIKYLHHDYIALLTSIYRKTKVLYIQIIIGKKIESQNVLKYILKTMQVPY